MTRLAYLLALIALVVQVYFVVHLEGASAILFVFVGMPCLGLALLIHFIQRWREGAFTFRRE